MEKNKKVEQQDIDPELEYEIKKSHEMDKQELKDQPSTDA